MLAPSLGVYMKKLLLLMLLCISMQSHAQVLRSLNQNFVVTYAVFHNLIVSPQELIRAIKRPSQRRAYEYFRENTRNPKQYFMQDNSCEQVCPESFAVLEDAYQKMQPDTGEHILSFLNEKKDFAGFHQRTLGYCWGHTTMTRNFNYLAYFDPAEEYETAPIRSKDRKSQRKWRRFYKKKIKKIMRGKAVVIPGFANVREFSTDPEILKIMKLKTVTSWWKNAVRVSAVPVFLTNFKKPMNVSEITAMIGELKERLEMNITPKIYMANLKKPMFMHIISVYDIVEDEDGTTRVCILDNHQYEEELRGCQTYLRVYPDGKLFYPGWEEPERELEGHVRRFGFTPEDNREMVKFTRERINMCKRLTQCE
jgi:hypothetical protein